MRVINYLQMHAYRDMHHEKSPITCDEAPATLELPGHVPYPKECIGWALLQHCFRHKPSMFMLQQARIYFVSLAVHSVHQI